MDFDFTEEQLAVSEAAATIFEGMSGADRVAEIENTADRFDAALWSELAKANLLGLAVPEEHGGSGLGLTELCLVLEQQGRAVAPVPLWATVVLGALPVGRFGTPEQKARWLPAVAAGEVVLSAALNEVALSTRNQPTVRAERDGEGWLLHGTAFAVPQAHLAARVLVRGGERRSPRRHHRGPGRPRRPGGVAGAGDDDRPPDPSPCPSQTRRPSDPRSSWPAPVTEPSWCRGCSTGPGQGCVPSNWA